MIASRIVFPIVLVIVMASLSSADQNPGKVIESPWMGQSELDAFFRKLMDSRFMPFQIIGKKENDVLYYKGHFKPYPSDLDRFFAYWAMPGRVYQARKVTFQNEGFEEIWHQSFFDAAHTEIHQAVWLRVFKDGPDTREEDNKARKDDEEIGKKTDRTVI